MLEKFQAMLEELKNKKEKELIPTTVEQLQDYFKMQDYNKMLKFNAITPEQLNRVNEFEDNLKKVFAKLYVPYAHSLSNT